MITPAGAGCLIRSSFLPDNGLVDEDLEERPRAINTENTLCLRNPLPSDNAHGYETII